MQIVYMLIEAINLTTSGESQLIERGIKYLEFPLIHHFIRQTKKNMYINLHHHSHEVISIKTRAT